MYMYTVNFSYGLHFLFLAMYIDNLTSNLESVPGPSPRPVQGSSQAIRRVGSLRAESGSSVCCFFKHMTI